MENGSVEARKKNDGQRRYIFTHIDKLPNQKPRKVISNGYIIECHILNEKDFICLTCVRNLNYNKWKYDI